MIVKNLQKLGYLRITHKGIANSVSTEMKENFENVVSNLQNHLRSNA